ncbi:hypothetical protein C8024_03445 [Sphingopyxis sp. BSNA05]|uniref:hypothetical protein n=1 Tax=Sphingopyxis sp. BSNA05 TaxID=1236614 RepID=UPI001566E330|nr:hypothetical protein [Sphingopyxis sp. BSNA05]NRD88723.1 hypothetical protein [Sphingopyxis sp. BSNA05]
MAKDDKIIEPINAPFDAVAKAMAPTIRGGANNELPVALYSGVLPIGGVELDCAVLEDGTRACRNAQSTALLVANAVGRTGKE